MATDRSDSGLGGVRLLLVEDEPDSRELLAELLRLGGARVIEADGGHRAYDLFLEERPDVVLSDLRMPDGDGYELVRRIRGLDPASGGLTPAVAVSASDDMGQAILAGFHAFLAKPVDPEHVLEVIRDFAAADGAPQGMSPWSLSKTAEGPVALTLLGHVRRADVRQLAAALAIHLENGPVEVVADLQRVTSFAPSAGSAAERSMWDLRHRIRRVRVVGGLFTSRLLTAGACKALGLPCTFSRKLGGSELSDP